MLPRHQCGKEARVGLVFAHGPANADGARTSAAGAPLAVSGPSCACPQLTEHSLARGFGTAAHETRGQHPWCSRLAA